MTIAELRAYLDTRRLDWPYGEIYHVDTMGEHRFVAKIGDELAGLSYAEIIKPVTFAGSEALAVSEARMKMNLKSQYAEYGIGTELLYLLMEDLKESGFETIRYEISRDRYAYQIYHNLGFEVESQDLDTVRFIWHKEQQ